MTLTTNRPSGGQSSSLQQRDGFLHVRLEGTPEQMGEQHGEMLRDQVRGMLDALNHHVVYGQPGIYGVGLRASAFSIARMMERRITETYRREMRALARAADVPYAQILLLNCVDDVLANLYQLGELFGRLGCSAFAAAGSRTPNGELLCGRNLDYFVPSAAGEDAWAATNYIKQHVMTIDYAPEGGRSFVAVGWPGFVGVATGMNADGLCLGSLTVSTRRNWPWATPATFIYRDILEQTAALDPALDKLRVSSRTQGNNLILGSGAESDARVVEFTTWHLAVRKPTDGWICATNHFVAPDMLGLNAHGVVFSSGERLQRMGDICAVGTLADPAAAGSVLIDQVLRGPEANEYCGIFNPCTIYSVVFAPEREELWVRVADHAGRTFERIPVNGAT